MRPALLPEIQRQAVRVYLEACLEEIPAFPRKRKSVQEWIDLGAWGIAIVELEQMGADSGCLIVVISAILDLENDQKYKDFVEGLNSQATKRAP